MERHHHRSKSQLAKSLLHKVSSARDSVKSNDDSPDNSPSHPDGTSLASDSNVSLRTPNRLSRSRSQNAPAASSSLADSGIVSPPESENMPLPQAGPVGLEQSVRLFRYVEALRNGDKEAISRAIKEQEPGSPARLQETTLLHLAIQCAEFPVIERVLATAVQSERKPATVLNARDKDGNTPLHIASKLGRVPVVRALLEQDGINDAISNLKGETALDVAYSAEIFQELQLARSLYVDANVRRIQSLVAQRDYGSLEKLLNDSRVRTTIDLNGMELATDRSTVETGGTLLHEAARKREVKLIQVLLMSGADPFRRDRKGKLAQDVTKDEKTRHILKRSPAAEAAKRSVQEKSILGAAHSQAGSAQNLGENPLGGKESREMKGYLKKWTNYTSGWKLRWFVLEEGVLSYYKHQDDAGAACRGAINMRIAKLSMDPQDKLRFEIQGKSSVKYHLKANHQVEAKRWYWALNNAIQWTKDEDREEQKRVDRETEALKNAKAARDGDSSSLHSTRTRSNPGLTVPAVASSAASGTNDDDEGGRSLYESSIGAAATRTASKAPDAYDEDEELGDDASSHEVQPVQKDALNIAAQSVKLQLDLLANVTSSLSEESKRRPDLTFSDPLALQAISTYVSAVGNLKGLIGDFLRITNDREAYWQYIVDREANIRMMWEESMAKVAKEQEVLENRMGEVEDKRKRTKRALRDALENLAVADSGPASPPPEVDGPDKDAAAVQQSPIFSPARRKPTIAEMQDISDSESDDEEFFDAVGAGEVEVVDMDNIVGSEAPVPPTVGTTRDAKLVMIKRSFRGYEDDVRTRLKMDSDDRPKISLWGILKSMIGKDMTRMTLPVSFNEPTSLLQRVAEDMEYTALLDKAAELDDPTERILYVAAFAASEYASTIGRVAKPFNPLLGETYEYARPDRGYRFFIEQVSHHPPVGAAHAESATWEYYGESAVKSRFYGKSFDFNPLGTWFLNLRPKSGIVERYTWKKVTSSVVGIISGSPTVDNYGPMVVKNWTSGETCTLDFKPRGWKASSAYIVNGRVLDSDGKTRWSVGGRWSDKLYARLTPGYEDSTFAHLDNLAGAGPKPGRTDSLSSSQAFLVWEANARPNGVPFNLTPFGVTLNALPDRLRPHLPPTDTRLRPDQRAMEDGEYDFAATEKNRLEEKQRAKRRWREQRGESFVPRWFTKATCEVTGEEYWKFSGEYWEMRERVANGGKWTGLEDIF